MGDYTIEKDREFGFLRTSLPPSVSFPRRSEAAELQIPAVDIVDAVEAVVGVMRGRRVLDIGCRDGGFLTECRERGMVCAGWEDIPAWADAATAHGFSVATRDLTEFLSKTDGKRFDVVSLLNVLPFVDNPAKVLNDVRQNMLANKGTVIVGVPNTFSTLQAVATAELGMNEWWVVPGTVFNYFTSETLIDLLEGCAFAVIDVFADLPREVFMLAEPGTDRSLQASLARKRQFRDTARKHGIQSTLKDLSSALGRLGLGDNIIAIARPDAFSKPCKAKVIKNREK